MPLSLSLTLLLLLLLLVLVVLVLCLLLDVDYSFSSSNITIYYCNREYIICTYAYMIYGNTPILSETHLHLQKKNVWSYEIIAQTFSLSLIRSLSHSLSLLLCHNVVTVPSRCMYFIPSITVLLCQQA